MNKENFNFREFVRSYLREANVATGTNPSVNVQGYGQGAGAIASVSGMIQVIEQKFGSMSASKQAAQGYPFTYTYAGVGQKVDDLAVFDSSGNKKVAIELKYSRDRDWETNFCSIT